VQAGGGSASARSMRLGSWVIAKAADAIVRPGIVRRGALPIVTSLRKCVRSPGCDAPEGQHKSDK